MTLVNDKTRQMYQLDMSMVTGQRLSLEMNGLAADRCGDHHVGPVIAKALGMEIESLVLEMINGSWMAAFLVLAPARIDSPHERTRVRSDVAAALSLAIHISLPIYVRDRNGVGATEKFGLQEVDHRTGHFGPAIPSAFYDAFAGDDFQQRGEDAS